MLAGEVSYVVVVVVVVAGESPWDLRLTEPIREMWEEDMAGEDSTEEATQLNTRSKMARTARKKRKPGKRATAGDVFQNYVRSQNFSGPTPGRSYRLLAQTQRGW